MRQRRAGSRERQLHRNEDTLLTIAAPGVLDNDTDDNGDARSALEVTGPAHGMLVLNADGSFAIRRLRTTADRTASPTGPTTARPTPTG